MQLQLLGEGLIRVLLRHSFLWCSGALQECGMPGVQALGNVQVQIQAAAGSNLTSKHMNQLLLQEEPRLAETTCCMQASPPR